MNTLVGRLVYRHYTRVRLLDANAVNAYEHTLKAQHHMGLDEVRLAARLNPSNAHFQMIVGATLAYMEKEDEALK